MGGQIAMAFRFANGEACCFERWTNNMPVLADLRILDGDETPVRDYIAMTRNNDYTVDPGFNGLPVRFQAIQYGFVLIDYMSKTILDINSYSSLFGGIHAFEVREPVGNPNDDYFSRKYYLIRDALAAGRAIHETTVGEDKTMAVRKLEGLDALEEIVARGRQDRQDNTFALYDIDTAPFRYVNGMDKAAEKVGRDIAREVGFPFTRREGLNANYPYPKIKRHATETEVKARYCWMKMKESPEYKAYDGVPWEKLSQETQQSILSHAAQITDKAYHQMQLNDMISASTVKAVIKIG